MGSTRAETTARQRLRPPSSSTAGSSTAHIAVSGELDLANAKAVEQQILRGVGGEPTAVTLDLTGLRYIDSAGLWILFRLGTHLATAKIAGEVVVPADGPVWRMVETAGVADAIPVRPQR